MSVCARANSAAESGLKQTAEENVAEAHLEELGVVLGRGRDHCFGCHGSEE